MFEGIVTIEKHQGIQQPDGTWALGKRLTHKVQRNSITATGIAKLMNGTMFGAAPTRRIHAYSHDEAITPAVYTVSGYLDTAVSLSDGVITVDHAQALQQLTSVGRFDPPGVARTIKTIGMANVGDEATPSFAVRLQNPVTQAPGQIVTITYSLTSRKANNTTTATIGGTVLKVSDNVWTNYAEALFNGTLNGNTTARLLQSPDDFSTGSNLIGRNALVENIGGTLANALTTSELAITAATTVKYVDEATTQTRLTVNDEDAVGRNFNKTLISASPTNIQLYVNDMGGTYSLQNKYHHAASGTSPYPTLTDPFPAGTGEMTTTMSSAALKFPTYVTATVMNSGDVGSARYFITAQSTQGFILNDESNEATYRLPALGKTGNAYISATSYHTGVDLSPGANVFSARISNVDHTDQVGTNNQSDALCSYTTNSIHFITNLGTTVHTIDVETQPSFTAIDIRQAAVTQVSGLSRLFFSCTGTGLWRINETLTGETFTPGAAAQVAVPIVTNTTCYAVAAGHRDGVIFAAFDGGIARSLNNGTTWAVYNAAGGGALPLTAAGLTDANWSRVKAIVAGPTDVGAGTSVIALVMETAPGVTSVRWLELSNTAGTDRGTTTVTGDDVSTRTTAHAYVRQVGAGVPATSRWVFASVTDRLTSVLFTQGVGPSSSIVLPGDFVPLTSTMLEFVDSARSAFGILLYKTSTTSAVLTDSSFVELIDYATSYTAPANGRDLLLGTTCRPYRHLYCSFFDGVATYFNPLAGAGWSARYITHRDYEWDGSQWLLLVDNRVPDGGTYGLGGPYSFNGRLVHDTDEALFSSGPLGILQDLPVLTMSFDPRGGAVPFIENEAYTMTITSGIQVDEFTSFIATAASSFYRSADIVAGEIAEAVAGTATGLAGRYVNFVTLGVESHWASQRGVVSSPNDGSGRFVRSELVSLDNTHSFDVSWKVTQAASTGTFAVGIGQENMVSLENGGPDTVITELPIRVVFTGQTYQVFVDAGAATAALGLVAGDVFNIAVDGLGDTFDVSVNGVPLALSVANDIPVGLTNGDGRAVGCYVKDNLNRYAYDFTVGEWDTATVGGDLQYYRIRDGGVDISADSAFVTVESRIDPPTSSIDGIDVGDQYLTDAWSILVAGQVKLLPKSGLLLAHTVPSIDGATFTGLVYKK